VDHRQSIPEQLSALGHTEVDYIANFNNTDAYWAIMSEVIRPEGKIVSIVENEKSLDLSTLKAKSATFAWEFMFTRSMFQTHDIQQQHELLNRAARLIDAGKLRTTLTETLTPIKCV
jgi:NADPH:quinone reductase-like Zn-dependent oxidoreductase